jgi:hypothetical protein
LRISVRPFVPIQRRFNKLHAYGAEAERVDSLMMGPGHMSERADKMGSAARF